LYQLKMKKKVLNYSLSEFEMPNLNIIGKLTK